jgi:hypothetical protein
VLVRVGVEVLAGDGDGDAVGVFVGVKDAVGAHSSGISQGYSAPPRFVRDLQRDTISI